MELPSIYSFCSKQVLLRSQFPYDLLLSHTSQCSQGCLHHQTEDPWSPGAQTLYLSFLCLLWEWVSKPRARLGRSLPGILSQPRPIFPAHTHDPPPCHRASQERDRGREGCPGWAESWASSRFRASPGRRGGEGFGAQSCPGAFWEAFSRGLGLSRALVHSGKLFLTGLRLEDGGAALK